jgi:hypothetical protein
MQRAKLQAAMREGRIQPLIRERQNAAVCLQRMAFERANLHS